MRALAMAQRLAVGAEGEQAARLAEGCNALRERTRQAFSVRVERAGDKERASPQWNSLRNARILPKWKWETLMPDPEGGPDDLLLILAQVKAGVVFIRVLEVATNVVRTRATLRAPMAFELLRIFLRNGRLFLIGRLGALLELDVHDWAVLQWCPNILRPTETPIRIDMDASMSRLAIPEIMMEDCTISMDGRYLWAIAMKCIKNPNTADLCHTHRRCRRRGVIIIDEPPNFLIASKQGGPSHDELSAMVGAELAVGDARIGERFCRVVHMWTVESTCKSIAHSCL